MAAGARTRYEPGATLVLESDPATHVLVILSGQVKMTKASADGREIIVDLRGPDSVIGELGAIDNSPRIATVSAVEPVEALVLTSARFRQILQDEGSIAYTLLRRVTGKLREATDRHLALGTRDALARLCSCLLRLAEGIEPDENGVIEIDMPLTQQEMAAWIGASRDAVVLGLRSLRQTEVIETGRRTIRILDRPALEARGLM